MYRAHSLSHPQSFALHQRGATLVVTLVLLVVVIILGVSAAVMGNLGERMARNSRDQNIALQAAEAALRDARQDILTARRFNGGTGATATCDGAGFKGFCLAATTGAPVWDRYLEDTARSVQYGELTARTAAQVFRDDSVPGGVRAQPRYVIEALPDPEGVSLRAPSSSNWVYRITAIGYGALPGTQVIVQEVIRP